MNYEIYKENKINVKNILDKKKKEENKKNSIENINI